MILSFQICSEKFFFLSSVQILLVNALLIVSFEVWHVPRCYHGFLWELQAVYYSSIETTIREFLCSICLHQLWPPVAFCLQCLQAIQTNLNVLCHWLLVLVLRN